MPNLNPDIQAYKVNKVALSGINSFDDPKDIGDTECTDILNMTFDNGAIAPRQGSYLYALKPDGETAAPFQFLVPTTSDGIDYMIGNYAKNFYLRDTAANQWVKLNQVYTPPSEGLYYGSTSWNNGIIDDRFYFGNGTDDTMKWVMAVNNLAVAAGSGDTTLTLNDSVRFPTRLEIGPATITIASPAVVTFAQPHGLSVGNQISFQTTGALPTGITAGVHYFIIAGGFSTTAFEFSTSAGGSAVTTSGTQSGIQTIYTHTIPLILKQPGSAEVNLHYTANSSNVLTLTGAVGSSAAIGSTVTLPILDMPNIPKGKILLKFQNRLMLFNSYKAENTFNYSVINDAESFVEDNTAASGGFYTVYKGKGGIVNVDDFGQYLVIEKNDIMMSLEFQYTSDNTGFILQVVPIVSGESIGPVSNANSLNYMNTIYYTTRSEGIVSFAPAITGSQTSASLGVLSKNIQNYVVNTLNFTNGRTAGFNQKLFWLNAVPIINGLSSTVNNGVLMYDLLRGAWTRFDNWQAADIKPINNVLYYISLNDGAVYQCFVDYQDAVGTNPYGYEASFTTKRFDWTDPELISKGVYVYIQGYIDITSKFYVDVLFNENGSLGKQTYEIDGSNSTIVQNGLLGGLGAYPFGIPMLGGFNLRTMQNAVQPAFFRCYLELSQAFRPANIQIRCYSQDIGSYWSPNNLTLMALKEPSIPTQLVLSPTTNPPIVL